MRLVGANRKARLTGLNQLPGRVNYFSGHNPKEWRTNIPTYAQVKYEEIYKGVSLIYYGNQKQLEYDFRVAPGADPSLIRLAFAGADRISLAADGDLVLLTACGEVVQHRPIAYQETASGRVEIAASYRLTANREIRFAIGAYDRRLPLVIDPVLSFSTYLGGFLGSAASCIAVDASGNAYVAGGTTSNNFPVTANAYRTVKNSTNNIFVTKLNATGTAVLFSSYLADGQVRGIGLDGSNYVYITGDGGSPAFPTTPGAYQTSSRGGSDVFVAKLDTAPPVCTPVPPSGINCKEVLVYSTFVGGSNDDSGRGIAVDAAGNAFVAGQTYSHDYPTTAGALQTAYQGGVSDAFVTKVNPTGSALTYSTYLGGSDIHLINTGEDAATAIALDVAGDAFVTGWTDSASFPTTQGALQTACTNCAAFNPSSGDIFDGFVSKLNPTGSALVYSTYLGGSRLDSVSALAVDAAGNAYLTGRALSADFPVVGGGIAGGSGIQRTVDGGISWQGVGAGITSALGDTVTSIVIDPTSPSTLYAGSLSYNGASGVFKSTNGGDSWQMINTGLTATNVKALAIAATVPPTLYAGLEVAGVYKSTDGGANWQAANNGLSDPHITSLAVDPANPLTVYAGGPSLGVYRSTDGGAHWAYAGAVWEPLCLVFDPTSSSTVYAGRGNSVDKSTSGGPWEYVGNGISDPRGTAVRALAFNPAAPATIYAGTSRGVYKTTDAAQTPWVATSNGLSSLDVRALAIDPARPATVYAATANGVFTCRDGGANWRAFNTGMVGMLTLSLAIDPVVTSRIYASGFGSANTFVAKLNGSGSALAYSTYLPGVANGYPIGITFDSTGNALVFGTSTGGFPTTADALQTSNVGNDLFLAELDASGTHLLYGTYIGGNAEDTAFAIARGPGGNFYLTGWTGSTNFPTTAGVIQPTDPGMNDQAFVTKIAIPVTANYDQYATNAGTTLQVAAPGVLGNDSDALQRGLTAALVAGPLFGTLSLNGNGSFNYTPNANFVGSDSFIYYAHAAANADSNLASVVIQVGGSGPGCAASLSATGQVIAAGGGTGSVDVITTPGCSWNAYSNAPSFLTIQSGGSGTGPGTVHFAAAAYTGAVSRTGTLTVAGQTFTVIQNGPCAIVLTPDHQEIGSSGGGLNFDIQTGAGCSWTVGTNSGWLNITSAANGSGNATVSCQAKANTSSSPRTATINVNDQTFTVTQAGAPTAIRLERFSAQTLDESVYLEWKTGLEAANLGFNLYRERAGKREKVNPHLIAGSALLVKGAMTQAGHTYQWVDRSLNEAAAQYWLEDVDLNGSSTWHGPFFVAPAAGKITARNAASLLSNLGATGSPTLNGHVRPQAPVAGTSQQAAQQSLASAQALRLFVKEEGWYRVTSADLLAAGFTTSDPRYLQLYAEGVEQAIAVTNNSGGKDGKDAGNFSIEFYATGLYTPATNMRTYWLINGKQPGKRIQVHKGSATVGGARSFDYTVERRERSIYFAALRNGETENFFGQVVASQPVEQMLRLSHIDGEAGRPAELEVALQGVTDLPATPDHGVEVRLNGSVIGRLIFDGQQHKAEKFSVPLSLLREGDNLVTLSATNGASDISLVDYVRITYAHTYEADGDSLRCVASTTQGPAQTLSGFSSADVRLVDVTGAASVSEMVGKVERAKDGSYQITVDVQGPQRELLAFTDAQVKRPAAMELNQPSSLRQAQEGADLVIVTRRELMAALLPLAQLRQKQGLSVMTVDIEDVFDEFSFGEKSPAALGEFFSYTQANWKRKPTYVLLAGDGSYDPKNYLGFGETDLVPAKLVDTTYMETASDDWYVDFNNDGVADIAIGRLPMRTPEEAALVVGKLIAYEQASPSNEALLVADQNDGFNFEQASTALVSLLPRGMQITQLNRGRMGDDQARKLLLDVLNGGPKLVNYVGHGSADAWRGGLFGAGDAGALTNRDHLSVVVLMTCLNGYYDTGAISLGEALMKSPGGAVAVWASTGMSLPDEQARVNQEFYRQALGGAAVKGSGMRLGDAAVRAKAATANAEVRRTWVLLGDPSMQLR